MHVVRTVELAAASVLEGRGELDAYAAPDLSNALGDLASRSSVVIDLREVSFLDSTALGVIVKGVRELSAGGGSVRVVMPAGPAKRIFEITRLDSVLPISHSREAALAELGR